MYNLLTEPLIPYHAKGGERVGASLPEVYAALMVDGAVESFPALRPHQRHAWHAFLVQLGTLAMHRAGLAYPPDDAEEWRRIIRALTTDWPDDEPWQMGVDDITNPAFMQPPAGSAERVEDFKNVVHAPDELDMLVTSKNHDIKSSIGINAGIDEWLFALITLQTMEGFGGAGNYGVSRMNGGLGNRPAFSLAPASPSLGAHVQRDICVLLSSLPEIEASHGYALDNGLALLWTLPWDGEAAEALLLTSLDPLYLEVCRRVRIRASASGPASGIRATSKAARIEGKSLQGRTGDPWTPTDKSRDGLPLTLSAGGFNYKRVKEYLLSADWERPVLLRPTQAEEKSSQQMNLVARAMVRGQGKTEGYHERVIPIRSQRLRSAMVGAGNRDEIGIIAQKRVEEVGKLQRILSHAIQTFAARGDTNASTPETRRLAQRWLNRLDAMVDSTFFEDLQDEMEADPGERDLTRHHWLHSVIDHARTQLEDAMDTLPCPVIHRYKARTVAESLFRGRLRGPQGFPDLFIPNQEEMEA